MLFGFYDQVMIFLIKGMIKVSKNFWKAGWL